MVRETVLVHPGVLTQARVMVWLPGARETNVTVSWSRWPSRVCQWVTVVSSGMTVVSPAEVVTVVVKWV